MHEAMRDERLDHHLPPDGWQRQLDAIREGHCDLLPTSQLAPMARIQLARDASMAEAAREAVRPGKTVLLVAGRGHVLRGVGIPTWLPEGTGAKVAVAQAGSSRWRMRRMRTGCRRRMHCQPGTTAWSCGRSSGIRQRPGRMPAELAGSVAP